MSPIDKLLPHLAKAKRTAPGRWSACCPAHDDGSPSLSIRELDDGELLLHDFAGCAVGDIVGAVGLTVADLFPEKGPQARPPERAKPPGAVETLARFEPATADHPYIVIKKGTPAGLRVVPATDTLHIAGESVAGWLAVPVMPLDGGEPTSIQFIPGTGKKLNLPGAPMTGVFVVGDLGASATAYVCEGIGQAWACWKATGHAAVVCFGWSRVRRVAAELRQRDAALRIVVVPDAGKESEAETIANEVQGLFACMPDGSPANFDANDFALREGFDALEALLTGAGPKPSDPLAMLGRFSVNQEHVENMSDTTLIWRKNIASGHVIVYSGPAGSGKTAIAKFAAGELAEAGFSVFYFQEDAGAGELPAHFEHATEHGYKLLNSTLTGASPEDELAALYKMVDSGADLSRSVMFLDTLKKFVDLMHKGGTREFFRLMRSLSQRGATVILLGHTNKHKGPDDKLMFEGVGDVRNDVDELIYIDATTKDATGIVTMTLRPDKVRCLVEAATFKLDTTSMQVTAMDRVVDVAEVVRRQAQVQADAELIEIVRGLLRHGGMPKTALAERLVEVAGVGKRTARAVIARHLGTDPRDKAALWIETFIRTNNVRHVSLAPSMYG